MIVIKKFNRIKNFNTVKQCTIVSLFGLLPIFYFVKEINI